MAKINPLDHPIVFAHPRRLPPMTAWAGHVPFAMFIVDVLRPELLVELGTHAGVSYCAFCQAVQELDFKTRCYAIDTWVGDENSGFYGPEVLAELKRHHDLHYQGFSCLLQSNFDDALKKFEDGTIDLLHIDGLHPYESVKHDFENWLPKMSERGVVLFHDTNVRMKGFGVWRFWEELIPHYPHFEFTHEHGLGVIATGSQIADGLLQLLEASEAEAALWRKFFQRLGQRLNSEQELQKVSTELSHAKGQLQNILDSRAWRWVSRYGRVKTRLLQFVQPSRRPKDAGL
jgi:O-antigen biosynthesis protein